MMDFIEFDTTNVFDNVNVSLVHSISISVFLLFEDKYIITVSQKLNFMKEFIFGISVECLHSKLQATFLMHNYAHTKRAKHVNTA